MGQKTSVPTGAASGAAGDGLADEVAAVEAARGRLGTDLEALNKETRAQIGSMMEKLAWTVAGTGSAVLAGVTARNAIRAVWKLVRHTEAPGNPGSPDTSWGEAVSWSVLSGSAVGLARTAATRGAVSGWNKFVGTRPPGV